MQVNRLLLKTLAGAESMSLLPLHQHQLLCRVRDVGIYRHSAKTLMGWYHPITAGLAGNQCTRATAALGHI